MALPAPAIPKQPRDSTVSFVATQQLCYNFMKHPDTRQLTHATAVQTRLVRLPPAHHQHPRQTEQLHQTASTSKQSTMAAGGLLAAGGHPPACMTVAGNPATAMGGLPAAGGCFPARTMAAGDFRPRIPQPRVAPLPQVAVHLRAPQPQMAVPTSHPCQPPNIHSRWLCYPTVYWHKRW